MTSPDSASAGLSALVVEPLLDDRLLVMSRLIKAGFRVSVADSFNDAKPVLLSQPPEILISAVRLGAYNGLHLVLRGKSVRPDMAALVLSASLDVALRTEAESLGATYVVMPVSERELIAAILQTVFRSDPTRQIRPPFERRRAERRTDETGGGFDHPQNSRRRVLPWLVEPAVTQ